MASVAQDKLVRKAVVATAGKHGGSHSYQDDEKVRKEKSRAKKAIKFA